jgi:divalent metal cation (Fe/Co/Zn/Cd) transporter
MARVTRPETHTLTLQSGETLTVKKRLNAGERREMLASMRDPATQRMDGLLSGRATALAYLLDWNLKDDISGEPLLIKDPKTGQRLTNPEISSIMDSLDSDDSKEIERIIDEWDDKMLAERREEKKLQGGKPSSEPGSPSAPGSDSATKKSTS